MQKQIATRVVAGCTGMLAVLICCLTGPQAAVVVLAHTSELAYMSYAQPYQCNTCREVQNASEDLLRWIYQVNPKLIRGMLDHPDPEVRASCVLMLGGDRKNASYETTVRLIGDPDVRVRRSALGATALYGDDRLLPVLKQALKDRDRETQRAAANSLKGYRYRGNSEAERAIEQWIDSRQAQQKAASPRL